MEVLDGEFQSTLTKLTILTQYPEDNTDLYMCDERAGGPQRFLQQALDLLVLGQRLVARVVELIRVRDGHAALSDAKRGGRQQDQETHV